MVIFASWPQAQLGEPLFTLSSPNTKSRVVLQNSKATVSDWLDAAIELPHLENYIKCFKMHILTVVMRNVQVLQDTGKDKQPQAWNSPNSTELSPCSQDTSKKPGRGVKKNSGGCSQTSTLELGISSSSPPYLFRIQVGEWLSIPPSQILCMKQGEEIHEKQG